jgi:hypothetical protein
MVNIVGESRVRITIIENVAAMIDIVRIKLLATTNKKPSKIDPTKQDMKDLT